MWTLRAGMPGEFVKCSVVCQREQPYFSLLLGKEPSAHSGLYLKVGRQRLGESARWMAASERAIRI